MIEKNKQNRAAKKFGLLHVLSGYYMFRADSDPNLYIISNGVWGANATHLIFEHTSYEEIYLMRSVKISDVKFIETFDYDVSDHIFEENRDVRIFVHGVENLDESRAAMRNIAVGGSVLGSAALEKASNALFDVSTKAVANSVMKMDKKENVCKITCANGDESFFYFKNTPKNAEIINKISMHVTSKKSY